MHPSSLQRRQWTVCLIHHPHTDIGYTDAQARIERYHVQFIDRVLELRRAANARGSAAGHDDLRGFKWVSECFWSIEQWLRQAGANGKQQLADAIKDGLIGLSATYLHYTELLDYPFLVASLRKAVEYGKSIGVNVDSALSADVNGFSWGYADALAQAGVHNLMVCSHSHHGLAPIGKRQLPFRWRAPSGAEVLVWNGEHYMLGNSLGLAPRAVFSYAIDDELRPASHSADNLFYAEKRLPRYLRQLEIDEYPYDFVPINVAGMITDNAPPNENIIRFVRQWNDRHGQRVKLEMVTLSEFFQRLRKSGAPIPSYAGDWPDWWSDGVASVPEHTMIFRQAQRTYRALAQMPGANDTLDAAKREKIERQLALFAEHTFSHSDSMRAPWDVTVKMIAGEKKALAYELAGAVEKAVDAAQMQTSQAPQAVDQPFRYRVVNPTPWPMRDVAYLYLEGAEFETRNLSAQVVRAGGRDESAAAVPHQRTRALRGLSHAVRLNVQPHASVTLELRDALPTLRHNERTVNDCASMAAGVSDVAGAEAASSASTIEATPHRLVTPFVHIEYDAPHGITKWLDAHGGRDLVARDAAHAPLSLVYDVTPVAANDDPAAMAQARSKMGRNRKGPGAQQHVSTMESAEVTEVGPLFATVRLRYRVAGARYVHVLLTAFADLPRVGVRVRIHKDSVWEPENLYLSLPFATGAGSQALWVEKAGALVRPRQDQLPDTLTDFYCIQEGFALQSDGYGVAVATPDAPLLQLGPLEYGRRMLMGHPALATEPLRPYSWLMTNYWETNFEASLGGFYEFRYHVEWGPHLKTAQDAIHLCHAMNLGYRAFRVSGE